MAFQKVTTVKYLDSIGVALEIGDPVAYRTKTGDFIGIYRGFEGDGIPSGCIRIMSIFNSEEQKNVRDSNILEIQKIGITMNTGVCHE